VPRPCHVPSATALVVLCFCVGLRVSSARQLKPDDVSVTEGVLRVRVVHKGKSAARPLWVSYISTAAHDSLGPVELVQRWLALAEPGAGFWSDSSGVGPLAAQNVTRILNPLCARLFITVPADTTLSSHSMRIGASTSMQLLGVPPPAIQRRCGWSDAICG
jgi:integrase